MKKTCETCALNEACPSSSDRTWRCVDWTESDRYIIERLREDLLKYGMHLDNCSCFIPQGGWSDIAHRTKTDDELEITEKDGITYTTVKCTCGFEKAVNDEK